MLWFLWGPHLYIKKHKIQISCKMGDFKFSQVLLMLSSLLECDTLLAGQQFQTFTNCNATHVNSQKQARPVNNYN